MSKKRDEQSYSFAEKKERNMVPQLNQEKGKLIKGQEKTQL